MFSSTIPISFDFVKLNNKYIQIDYMDLDKYKYTNSESNEFAKEFEFRLVDSIDLSNTYAHYLAKMVPNIFGEYNPIKGFKKFGSLHVDNIEKNFVEFLLQTCIQYEKYNK